MLNDSITKHDQDHGTPYQSVPVYGPAIGTEYTELYRAYQHMIYGGCINIPPALISYRISMYCPYRVIRHGMTKLDKDIYLSMQMLTSMSIACDNDTSALNEKLQISFNRSTVEHPS